MDCRPSECEIGGSHSGVAEDSSLEMCLAVLTGNDISKKNAEVSSQECVTCQQTLWLLQADLSSAPNMTFTAGAPEVQTSTVLSSY